MSAGKEARSGIWPGMGSFCFGLAVIASASILNVAFDRMSSDEIDRLPVLATLYKFTGKLGVTLTLVTIGLAVIAVGTLARAVRCPVPVQTPAGETETPGRTGPAFYTKDEAVPETPTGGRIPLETRKYLPRAALSGATGWDMTQRRTPAE